MLGIALMGRIKGAYNAEYPVGTRVRIADRQNLEKFIKDWKYHNPLRLEQLSYANK
jgi:hypothetical protein